IYLVLLIHEVTRPGPIFRCDPIWGCYTQGRHEHDFEESNFEFITPEEVYTAEPDISTINVPVSTVEPDISTASPEVKTAAESLVYIRRSAAKRKDKGKAIMKEAEPKKDQQRAEQRRNKPMTQAQQRTYMCNYIKSTGSHTLQQLKKLSFDEIKELFETIMKRVKDFVPMESGRLVPKISTGSSKRTVETELDHEGSRRQKTNEEQSAEEEKELSEEEL
ncbi:hypothetical protein Tco_0198580, partial [Tanacetum coccineum]